MKVSITDEAIASEALFDYFSHCSKSTVHSWHPPDSKAYFTRLLYIPKNGKRSHVDLIVQIDATLYLIEVKDCLSNSYDDVAKLEWIMSNFSTKELVKLFMRQGLIFPIKPLETKMVIAARYSNIAFVKEDHRFAILLADKDSITAANSYGKQIVEIL